MSQRPFREEAAEELALHQEPLAPFTWVETLLSLPTWLIELVHLGGWLLVFHALDRTVMSGRRFDKLGKFCCRRATDLARIKVRRHGLEQLQPEGSYVFCINHVSMLDLFVVFQSIPHFHRSFQDAAHFKIPIYGGCIRIFGQIPVDRRDREGNQRAMAQAIEMLHQGDSFVVFPEGHRTRDGRLGAFYPGAFRLAIAAQVPLVPVALRGLRNLCPSDNWRLRSGAVDVLFGQPIATRDLSLADVPALSRRARAAMNELLARGPTRTEALAD